MTDREGKELAPTEFLHTRVLASESGELTDLGKSLVSLFPSLECATLPIPSINPKVLRDICNNQEKLSERFNDAVNSLVQEILQKVSPKKAVDGTATVNGKTLAALAGGYVEAVNRPGALPDLDQGWQAVLRLELKEASYRLVREYEREMEESLEGNLPMEESNLLRIHRQTLKGKKSHLRVEICRVNPLHSSDEDTQPLLDQLEQDIVQWSETNNDVERKVTGGVLYQFTEKNNSVSKKKSEQLLAELVKKSKVQGKVQEAIKDSLPLNIQEEVSEITRSYNREAVGPAARQVLERERKIPGWPRNVRVIGRGSDRVKLSWDPPEHNPEAVEEYVVYKRVKDGEWEEAVRTKKTRALVKGLKSHNELHDVVGFENVYYGAKTDYEFQVLAINSTVTSIETERSAKANPSTAAITTFGACAGAAASLLLPSTIGAAFNEANYAHLTKSSRKLLMGLSIAALPVSFALLPITAPVLAVTLAKAARHTLKADEGDLTEDEKL